MARLISLGAAQLGPIAKDESKAQVVDRLIALLHDAAEQAIELLIRAARVQAFQAVV